MRAGIVAEPAADRLHGHFGARDLAEVGKNAAGAGEALPALGGIGNAAQRAVGHLQPRRALHVDEEDIDLVLEPGDLQPLAGKRALFDGRTVEILDDACPGAAAEGKIRVEARWPVLFVDVDQVGAAARAKAR